MLNKLIYTCCLGALMCWMAACNKPLPEDYTSPFYKVFKGESKGRKYIIHLYRLPSIDTFDGPQYSGTIYDADEEAPMQFQTSADRKRPQCFSGGNECPFRLEINAAADALAGFLFSGPPDSVGRRHDSTAFTARETAMTVPFDYSGTAGMRYYDTARASSPQCQYRYGILRPVLKDTVARNMVRNDINRFFEIPDSAARPAQLLADRDYRSFMDGFRDLKGAALEEQLGYAMSSTSAAKTSEVVFAGKRWLSLALTEVSSGGAHDQTFSKYLVYDLQTGKKLQLRDVLTAAGIGKLPGLLAQSLRKQYNLAPSESLTKAGLNENSIYPGKNFYLTDRGIGFFYNNYEIASFAAGSYNLFVPFKSFGEGDLALQLVAAR